MSYRNFKRQLALQPVIDKRSLYHGTTMQGYKLSVATRDTLCYKLVRDVTYTTWYAACLL